MKVTTPGLVPVYTIAGASTARPLPDWLARRRKRSLKNDPEFANRVELLQDFEFEEASVCVRVSEDGNWAMSTGTYKPQMHVHSLDQLSLSYARHTTSLNNTFVLLGADYTKSLHLQSDRKLELHTPMGCHYEVRIPRYGRDVVYDRHSAEALIPAAGLDGEGSGEVFRLNLEMGRFMNSYKVDVGQDDGVDIGLQGSIDVGCVNTAAIADTSHNLLAFGTSRGTVEFWDSRSKSRVATLENHDGEVTALDFSPTGLSLATGTSRGIVSLFDMRRPVPMLTRDHGYGFAIQNLIHLRTASQEKKILASDKRIIKIFDEVTGDPWTSIEPIVDLHHVEWVKDSGMLLTANEGKQQHAFLIPALGPSPKWCTFLDNMVEEMAEEIPTETYDNYKFLTLPELKSLSLSHLIGKTNLLRPYMHGYFVASKLYEQARLIANPYVWEEERMKRVKERVEQERASRIRGNKKVKVNQRLADKIIKRQENREKVDTSAGVLGDDRFGKLFEDEEFAVDETSREFQALNPSTKVEGAAGGDYQDRVWRGDSSDESGGEDEEPIRSEPIRSEPIRSEPTVSMTVSSSEQHGRRSKDTALGSRVQKNGRIGKSRNSDMVGEKSVTFVPERKKKETPEQPQSFRKRSDGRRSASTNTFRRL